jgi:uncharacterized protein with HEPN domain
MENEIKKWLTDIEDSIEEIKLFLPSEKDFKGFHKDLKTRRAVERNIEIIGEAVNRILKFNPEYPIKNARRIIDTRNRIIHGYDSVSSDILWGIVIRELPELEKDIKSLLEANS